MNNKVMPECMEKILEKCIQEVEPFKRNEDDTYLI